MLHFESLFGPKLALIISNHVAIAKMDVNLKGVVMKNRIASILVICLTALTAFAAKVDFNSIIVENTKAQGDLHLKIKETVKEARLAAELSPDSKNKFIADKAEIIHIKTKKDVLKFAKEKVQYRPSIKQGEKRLAQEFKDLE
jgi:hypothetical protein